MLSKYRLIIMSSNSKSMEVFETMPVGQAVLKNALPAMAAMLMVLVYNLADTFFIGQTGDALLVAAVSLATPVFLIFTAVGTAFGAGGTSVISRSLGVGNKKHASKVCSFCMWGSAFTGIVLAVLLFAFMDPVLSLIGASADTWDYAGDYLRIVSIAAPFVLISNCFSNVIRAEGESTRAMMGQLIGNLLNVVLDPLMILTFGWGIRGAAIATVIGNTVGALYYISFFARGKSSLGVSISDFTLKEKVFTGVMSIGIPSALGSLLMSVAQIIMNALMAAYGDMAIAGMGVAMKVITITGMVSMGLGQGVQPLLGYSAGAGNLTRLKACLKFSLVFAFLLGVLMTLLCVVFLDPIVSAFLTDPEAYTYAVDFSKILLVTGPLFGVFYVLTNAIQAMGSATAALIVNLSRQGFVYIPALYLLDALVGVTGLAWAQPLADVISVLFGLALYLWSYKKLRQSLLPKEDI